MTSQCKEYEYSRIEPVWQSYWARETYFQADDASERPKYYILDMFPYPSGDGLHLGHVENYTASDILARYKIARGFNVLHPMGWDAFGLPSEHYAIKTGTHPKETNQRNVANFKRQIASLGMGFDWSREIDTTDPDYFRWTQWIFLRMLKKGLAYVDERPVWWCPALGTVLANEEIVNGVSERGGHPVERRLLRQWILRITAYADRLLSGLEHLDWPESTKRQQEAWIGRSEGAEIVFPIADRPSGSSLRVFTTRPDTLYGATYMVVAPEHPVLREITAPEFREAVQKYAARAARKSDLDRTDLAKEKSGVFTGAYAVNPVNEDRIPIWVADYVLMSYGTGAIMAVPAHDERDYEFAKNHEIPITQVIVPEGMDPDEAARDLPYTGEGIMVRSGDYTGLSSRDGGDRITQDLARRNSAAATVQYKLRDWLFSRQRYWGEPVPVVWVSKTDYETVDRSILPPKPVSYEKDGVEVCAVPLPDEALPLTLPDVESYLPTGTGESPLAKATDWVEIWYDWKTGDSVPASQPRPEGASWVRGRRETNTMPQWAGSSWYYLRFLDPHNEERIVGPDKETYWGGGPDFYIGGAEHAVLHLLYARFWHLFLYDEGVVSAKEPFRKLYHQGVILGADGYRMSKSRGNVANPDEVVKEYGADTLRLYLMFLGPLEAMKPWNPKGIEGVFRFLKKIWREYIDRDGALNAKFGDNAKLDPELERSLHETIRKVTEDIEHLRFNTAISQMMIFINQLQKTETCTRDAAKTFLVLLAPFAPHIAEELWRRFGESASILRAEWPAYDASKLAVEQEKVIFQVNGKYRGDGMFPSGASKEQVLESAKQHPRVIPFLDGKEIRKIIHVPDKILNLVVK